MSLSRMERLKNLHNEVNKEIAIKKQSINQNSLVYAIFEKIKIFDQNDYFKNKIYEFDKRNETEKPYFDKDREKNPIPDKFIPSLKEMEDSLSRIKTYVADVDKIHSDLDDKITLGNVRYINLNISLIENEKKFVNSIKNLNQKQISEGVFQLDKDIQPKTVSSLLVNDDRNSIKMNDDIKKTLDGTEKKLLKAWKGIKDNLYFKNILWVMWALIIFAIISIGLMILSNFI